MDGIGPSNPFHIARAYGTSPPARPAAVTPLSVRAPDVAASIGPRRPVGIARLVGGVVPGGIDFSTPQPTASKPALAFYRHPADQNAAATMIARGRAIDVKG